MLLTFVPLTLSSFHFADLEHYRHTSWLVNLAFFGTDDPVWCGFHVDTLVQKVAKLRVPAFGDALELTIQERSPHFPLDCKFLKVESLTL